MHLAVVIFTIICAWKWGDWKHWQKYHSTILYTAMGNLLYNVLYFDHWLWQYKQDFLSGHVISDILASFTILPLTALMFLTNYPHTLKGQLFRITKFITIYTVFEIIYFRNEILVYNDGWNTWLSIAWNCIMFPMIALHHKHPLMTYVASIAGVLIMLKFFPVHFK